MSIRVGISSSAQWIICIERECMHEAFVRNWINAMNSTTICNSFCCLLQMDFDFQFNAIVRDTTNSFIHFDGTKLMVDWANPHNSIFIKFRMNFQLHYSTPFKLHTREGLFLVAENWNIVRHVKSIWICDTICLICCLIAASLSWISYHNLLVGYADAFKLGWKITIQYMINAEHELLIKSFVFSLAQPNSILELNA